MQNRQKRTVHCLQLLLTITFLCMLTGCWSMPKEMYYSDFDREQIVSIDVYDCSEEVNHHQPVNTRTLLDRNPLFSLDDSQIDPFLQDLSEIRFYDEGGLLIGAVDPSFNFGKWVVKIGFTDGSYWYLSDRSYCAKENSDGSGSAQHLHPDSEEWEALIKQYMP